MKYQNKEWLQDQIKIHGANGRQIALANNYSPVTVQRYMKKFNLYKIKEKKEIKKKEEPLYRNKDWLQKQFDLYFTVTEVSKQTGYPRTCITRYAKKYDIYSSKFNRTKVNKIDENYFENIDTETKVYWLGFFMADANMYIYEDDKMQFSIKIQNKDHSLLERLKEDISFEGKVKEGYNTRNNTKCYYSQLRTYNKTFCGHLMKHGIVPQKTGKEIIPETVPEDLIKHFIRGFLDGDGSITNSKLIRVSICSSTNTILNQIKEYLLMADIDTKIYHHHDMYTLNTTRRLMTYKLLKFLYKDAQIYLDRKYNKARIMMLEYEITYL